MVVAAHPIAAEAGAEVLRNGGNAADAAIATSLTLGVVEPFASGLGGGGYFLICPRGDAGRVEIIDGRGTVSSLLGGERTYPFGVSLPWTPKMGPLSVSVPGQGRALALMRSRHGSRLSLPELCASAIRAAEEGFEVSKTYVRCQQVFEGTVRNSPACARTFLREGRGLRIGERLRQPELARTIRRLSEEDFDALYTGEIGRAMEACVNETGPVWGAEDLRRYEPRIRAPLRASVHGDEIATMPPPSRGGAGILAALRELERGGLGAPPDGTAEYFVAMMEIIRDTFRRLEPRIADPDHAEVRLSDLWKAAGTSHFAIADREGTIVTASQTIGHFFGAGLVARGVLLNDDLSDCDPSPGKPNSIQPGRRTISNMAPTLVFRSGRPFVALGTPGSTRIFPALAQVLARVVLQGLRLEEAVAAPRIHWEDGIFFLEGHIDPAEREKVRALTEERIIERGPNDLFFGGVHAIEVEEDGTVVGVADPRRDGVSIGL